MYDLLMISLSNRTEPNEIDFVKFIISVFGIIQILYC